MPVFSVAGTRTGFEGKSGLFMEAIRIIREMRTATYGSCPELILFENVPGLLSSGGDGSDYKTVLEAFTESEIPMPVSGRWAGAGMVGGCGFNLAWVIKDASKHFGVPQRRRRLFLVCDFTGSSQRAAKILFVTKSLPRYFAACAGEKERIAANAERGFGGAGSGMSFNSKTDHARCKESIQANQGYRSNSIMCAGSPQANAGMRSNLCPTLASVAYKNGPYIVHPSISGTLCASGAGLSRPAGMASETDLCVAIAALNCGGGLNENGKTSGSSRSGNRSQAGYVVRRLTPTECERLMGLPDGYTEYGSDGLLISDSARYQALGNSIVVNVLAYIMQNIAESINFD